MYFLIEDDDFLEKYNTIWGKVNADIKKEFDSEPVYNKTFLKTKIKTHGDEVTDFYDKKIPKVDCNHTCLAIISLDSALKKDGNYYPQLLRYKMSQNLVKNHGKKPRRNSPCRETQKQQYITRGNVFLPGLNH